MSVLDDAKQQLRKTAYARRRLVPEKERSGRLAVDQLRALPAYKKAKTAMWYFGCRSELPTKSAILQELQTEKRIVIPYCTFDDAGQNDLGLWWLKDLTELDIGKWGILEPPPSQRSGPQAKVDPFELDVIVTPGVAFSHQGVRLGNGKGYYDRLLSGVRDDCVRIGLCFQTQIFDQIPSSKHDVPMHVVVTEKQVYRCTKSRTQF